MIEVSKDVDDAYRTYEKEILFHAKRLKRSYRFGKMYNFRDDIYSMRDYCNEIIKRLLPKMKGR